MGFKVSKNHMVYASDSLESRIRKEIRGAESRGIFFEERELGGE